MKSYSITKQVSTFQAPCASKKALNSSLALRKRGVMQEAGEVGYDLGDDREHRTLPNMARQFI